MNNIPEKWYVKFGNEYQAEKVIIPYFKTRFPDKFPGNWRFTGADRCITNDGEYYPYSETVNERYKEITFAQFKQLINSPIPEKWCIKVTGENKSELQKTDKCGFRKGYDYTIGAYYSSISANGMNGFINLPFGYTEITFEQFKQFIAPDDYFPSVDFTVPGTLIPEIPDGELLVFECQLEQKMGWCDTYSIITNNKMVSFGVAEQATKYYGETYIKCERAEYERTLHFCFPLSTLNKLSNQKSSEMKKVVGYKLLKDTPDADAGTLIGVDGKYTPTRKDVNDYEAYLFPVSVLTNTNWFEPIYEQEKPKVGDIVKVTVRYVGSEATEGDIGRVVEIDDSDTPYNLYGFTFLGTGWAKKVVLATEEEINAAKTVSVGEYTSKFEDGKVFFGCQGFEKAELHVIEKLLEGPIYADITIEEKSITRKMVRQLLLNFA